MACAGIPVFIITYAPEVINYLKRQLKQVHYVWYALWVSVLLAVFVYIEQEVSASILWCGAVFALYVLNAVQEGVLISQKAFGKMTLVNFFYSCYFIAFHVFLLKYRFNLDWILVHLALGLVVKCIISVFIIRKTQTKDYSDAIPADKIKKMWFHMGLYDLVQIAFRYIDKFTVGLFLSAAQSGIYVNGSQEIPFIPLLVGAVGNAALVQLAANEMKGEKHEALNVSSKLLSCLLLPLFFFLFVFRNEFITVLFSEKYVASISVFAVYLWLLPLRTYNYTTLLQHLGKGAIINKGALLDIIIACALMYPLYVWLGLPGVALSFVGSTYIQVGYYLYHTSRLLNISVTKLLPVKNWLVKFGILGTAFTGFYIVVKDTFENKVALLIAGGILFLLSAGIAFMLENRRKTA
jgi:O-antigen/teichoic acid export membrane protein